MEQKKLHPAQNQEQQPFTDTDLNFDFKRTSWNFQEIQSFAVKYWFAMNLT